MPTNGATTGGAYEAFGRGDIPAVLRAFDAGIEWREAEGFRYADRNPCIGPAAVASGVFQRVAEDIGGFSLAVERVTEGGSNPRPACGVAAVARYDAALARGHPGGAASCERRWC